MLLVVFAGTRVVTPCSMVVLNAISVINEFKLLVSVDPFAGSSIVLVRTSVPATTVLERVSFWDGTKTVSVALSARSVINGF